MLQFTLVSVLGGAILLLAGCAGGPPKSFVKTHDESAIWKAIEIREGAPEDLTWKTIVDTLSQKYDLEVLQKDGGYVRSSWKFTQYAGDRIIARYRSRIIVKLLGSPTWTQAKIKCESHWLTKNGWIEGFDTILQEDVYRDLQGTLSRAVR